VSHPLHQLPWVHAEARRVCSERMTAEHMPPAIREARVIAHAIRCVRGLRVTERRVLFDLLSVFVEFALRDLTRRLPFEREP
jgi:hypothetical protein